MLSNYLLQQEEKRFQSSSPAALSTGRMVGILLLLQLTAALTLPFILSKPITLGSPAFLSAVTEHSFQIRAAVLLSFVGAGLTIYLGITAFPVFRLYRLSNALLFLVVCALSATLDVVQAATIMSMLSISQQFVMAVAPDAELYMVLGAIVAS